MFLTLLSPSVIVFEPDKIVRFKVLVQLHLNNFVWDR